MEIIRKNPDTQSAEKMTDEELSRRLGRYQKTESIGILLGILLVIAGCITMFIQRDVVLVSALVFPGVALLLLVAKSAQIKKKALMKQQLGDYFRTELTRAFGPEPETPELLIDQKYLKGIGLLSVQWSECSVDDFHEGVHDGLRFSAANVELRRTVEERSGPNSDNWMTRTETLFHGIVVRCNGICDSALDMSIRGLFQERKKCDLTDPNIFRKHFKAETMDGQQTDDQVTPQIRELILNLEAFANNGKVGALILYGGNLTLALNTGYVFADIPDALDLRDIEGIRRWYTASLTGMGRLLDLLMASPALTGKAE